MNEQEQWVLFLPNKLGQETPVQILGDKSYLTDLLKKKRGIIIVDALASMRKSLRIKKLLVQVNFKHFELKKESPELYLPRVWFAVDKETYEKQANLWLVDDELPKYKI